MARLLWETVSLEIREICMEEKTGRSIDERKEIREGAWGVKRS